MIFNYSITKFPDYSILIMKPGLNPRREPHHSREHGYILLTLLLIIALGIIFAAVIIPSITFEIRRDREEEMIHRGVQYSRAIRVYYKKFGRYPTKLEDLESANNIRFLRKRYKDPITGQDFKLLHFGDVKLSFSGGIGGGTIPGANTVGGNSGNGNNGLNGSGGFGQTSTFGGNNGFGANSNSSYGQNPLGQNSPNPSQPLGGDPTQPSPSQTAGTSQTDATNKQSGTGDQLAGVTFGGGPVVGVASSSKKDTIREFNHKKKYNEWQFIYDPATDRGGLLMTPNQPQLQGFGQQGMQNVNGQPNSGFGQPAGGMQNNPNLPSSGGFGTPAQPSNPTPPPQQQ